MNLAAKKTVLENRQKIFRAIRETLDKAGYLEVQVPILIRGTNPDSFLTSFEVFEDEKQKGYLTTSTEFQILRLLADGYDKVYTLTSNFRAGDKDATHNPEFTMLEWEAANVGMETIESEAEEIVLAAFRAVLPGAESLEYHGRATQIIGRPWERLTVRQALKKHLGLEVAPDFSLASMAEEIKKAGLKVPAEFLNDRGLLFSFLINDIQEKLGIETPTWITEWPIFQTSMAEPLKDNPEAAERSELYITGLEIANGFTTVSDIEKQKALFEAQQEKRVVEGKKKVALDEKYLADLAEKPLRAAGMALGIDRLVMILCGVYNISEVLALSWDEL